MEREDRQRLSVSEKAWRTFRDTQCEFETSGTLGGTIHSEMLFWCKDRYASQYAKDLQHQLDCVEGDLSCAGHFKIYLYQKTKEPD
jgi:uncharacterized protein YecT (DUF1311 family)